MKTLIFDELDKYTPKRKKTWSNKIDDRAKQGLIDETFGFHNWHLLVFFGLIVLTFFVFTARAISIQVIDRQSYLSLGEKNRIREFSLLPGRGLIKDRNGEVIVRNKPSFSLELNTLICGVEDQKNCQVSIQEVSKYLDLKDFDRINRELEGRKTNIILATSVTKEDILPLEANIKNMPGVSIEAAPAREYLYTNSFSHLLGYVGLGETLTPIIVGKTGIEEKYNAQLSGVAGVKIVQVDSAGTSYRLISSKDYLPGKDLELFVDVNLQNKAYELLIESIEDDKSVAKAGAIVAQDPRDGSVLALVSYPGFDPQKLSSGISSSELAQISNDIRYPFFNRAVSAVYPPGSTFKMVTSSAVLMEGIADENLTIFDPGYIQVGSFIFRNWNTSGHGEVNLLRAIQVSNDTYFYTVGGGYGGVKGLGIEKLHKWADKFGYGKNTGIDLGGEVPGFMPNGTHREWYLGDDYISSIGQGDILATPLQVNNMTTYFANGGVLYSPRIVKSIEGRPVGRTQVLEKDMLDDKSYDLIRKGIFMASSSGGTAYPFFDFSQVHSGMKVAGKTGTSEFINSQGEDATHAWFSVFAPYYEEKDRQANLTEADRPIVVTVFLEGGGGGSDDAAPIARKLLDHWFEE